MSTPLNERMEFAPPPTPGLVRALGLALVAHALLLAFLALGVQWKREPPPVTVEAELWSSIPQQAAEPAPEPVAEDPPEPAEPPQPVVKPKPVVVAPPVPVEPTPDPSIAIAKEKARLQKEKQVLKEKQEKELEKQKLARLEQENRDKEALKNKKLQEEKDAREKEQREKLARDKKAQKNTRDDAAKAAAETKKREELRQQSIKRMMGLAGTGDAGSTGTAAQSSGPSAGYAGKIRARIKPNITYTENIAGNPAAEVEVRTAPAGTIISRRLTQSSGVKSWDEAVLNAIDKTETLPRDTDGRVPSTMTLVFRPKD